ncbi:hypothetical protein ILUMI_10457, partial [Ignelater luminosus]
DIELKQLYDGPLKLPQNKLDGLSILCNKNHTIIKYHDFYTSLDAQYSMAATINNVERVSKKEEEFTNK